MSDATQGQAPQQPVTIHAQYIKDLSFENPRAPDSLRLTAEPAFKVNIQSAARNLNGMTFEVQLTVEVEGKDPQGEIIFMLELAYCAIATIAVPQEHVGPVLGIHIPMLAFPFARAIIAQTMGNAGLPPLMLNPVDFGALYQQQIANQQGGQVVGNA